MEIKVIKTNNIRKGDVIKYDKRFYITSNVKKTCIHEHKYIRLFDEIESWGIKVYLHTLPKKIKVCRIKE